MCPHAQHLYDPLVGVNGVHKAMLDVDPPRVGPRKITYHLFIRWKPLKRIRGYDGKQLLGFWFQSS